MNFQKPNFVFVDQSPREPRIPITFVKDGGKGTYSPRKDTISDYLPTTSPRYDSLNISSAFDKQNPKIMKNFQVKDL